jgi:hypothetical protein
VGGFASRAVCGCLILVGVGCGVGGLGWRVGCGVCVVCDVCVDGGGRWIGDLRFCFGRGVSLGGLGWRHGWIVPGGVQWREGRSDGMLVLSSCSCNEAWSVSEACR